MYLHIERQRALNGRNILCTGAYLACRLDKRLFVYIILDIDLIRCPMNIIWLYKRLWAGSKISNQSQLLLY